MKKRISRLMMAIFVIATTFQVFPITNPGVSKVLANDSGWAVYEAEAEQCGGYAVVKEDKNASGGAVVSRIGAPNTDLGSVTFDIYAPKDGTYDATIKYISQNSDSFYVLVNNQEKIEIKQGVSVENKATAPGISNIQLNLKGGSNRVKVYSDKSYALDLDCIIVKAEREKLENVYESSSAKLSGDAKLRRIYKAQDGYGIAGLGTHGSAEFDITSGSGTYTLGIWYSAAEYRGLEVYVDNNLVETLYCPITAEDFNIETITTDIDLSAGRHKIKFTNKYSTAPDIDKIQLIKTEKVGTSKTSKGIKNFGNKHFNIKYNMETGKADLSVNDVQRVKGIESVVKLEDENKLNTAVKSSDYTYRRLETKELNDGYGKGKVYTVISNSVGIPEMRQNFYVYDEKPYALISVELSSPNGVKSNFMAPITAMGDNVANIGNIDDGRSMFVPYDNDAWVRYRGDELSGVHTSYWTTSVYDNTSRNSIVMGSVDHDTWKSGTSTYSADSKNVNFLGSFGGIWSAKYTYDYHPHGSIDGTTISSPKMFIGYFEDWRDGMETYGEANNCNVPMLKWESGVPFGYNSWYGQGSKVNYKDSCDVSDFVKELQDTDFHDDEGVAYVNLDSYWDSFSDEELKKFVEKCHNNGQKAGIYWSHFVFWATDMSWKMGVPGTDYTYRDAALNDENGGVVAMAKDSGNLPLDPTSDAMKARLDYFMTKFVDLGFEFLKIDFLNYAAIEGVHADPNVKTGMQAYNQALKLFTDYVDTDKFFLSYSIAPIFPYQYAHARRISCDTAANIGEVSYMMNSLNFGWWMDDTLYKYVDPDHISFAASPGEARTRYNSAVVTGTLMLLSDSYKNPAMKDLTRELTSNKEINDIARMGKAFRPLEGNVGEWATDTYVLETEKAFYIAVFNFEQTANKTININFERAGLKPDTEYTLTDLWTQKRYTATNDFKTTLMPTESTIYKIDR